MNANRREEGSALAAPNNRSVLFLVNALNVGGSERKSVRLANALATTGRRVALAYLSPPEALLSQLHPAVAAVNLRRRGKFSIPALRRLADLVRERDIASLVAMNLYAGLYAVLAARLCRNQPLRVAVSVNTTEFASAKERRQMLIYRRVLRRADVVAFGAESQRQLWSSRYGLGPPEKLVVLYNGVDTAEFSRGSVTPAAAVAPPGRVLLGTVGALRVEKAHVDLVRAVHELTTRGMDVGALIVGDGAERPRIEDEIRRFGVGDRVHLVGEAQDVRPYLTLMDIFVLPSVAVETFSNAALEAMAMSCPVVAARVGGMDEMLHFGGGVTYPPGDVKALCDLLVPLIAGTETRRQLGERARQVAVERFSFDRMLTEFGERIVGAAG
jgi:glycosyltransferase involved in cell wall biosynthesis